MIADLTIHLSDKNLSDITNFLSGMAIGCTLVVLIIVFPRRAK